MKSLDRKLVRDLWQLKGQLFAIALVMACGIATFVMSASTLQSLVHTQQAYYERCHFSNVFAHLKRAPESLLRRIREIAGVAQVEARIVEVVTLDVEGFAEPVMGRLVSLPAYRPALLNQIYLRSGRLIEPGRAGEVLVSEGFASAHRLGAGSTIRAVINGRFQTLQIVGVALSPEFIYSIRPGDLLPDDRRYAIVCMSESEMSAAFDMKGAFNDVCLSLLPTASLPDVIAQIDRLIEPYGGLGAYGRADQASHRFVSNELKELRGMAMVAPAIFLAVAAFLLNMVIARLMNTQREQVAALKAFGYTGWEIASHYLKMVLVILLVGSIIGTLTGIWFGTNVTKLYNRFFHFPLFTYEFDLSVLILALSLSGLAAIMGTLGVVYSVVRMPPAEAMRPASPASYRKTFPERLGLVPWLSPELRMILRNLDRHPWKATFSCLGIALAVAVQILGSFMRDAVDYALTTQFQLAQRQDLMVGFVAPTHARALHDLQQLSGVVRCEPFRSVAVRLRAGHRARRVGILGIKSDGELFRLIDLERREIVVPDHGLVVSSKLAQILGIQHGENVVIEVLEEDRPIRTVKVAGLISDFEGTSAYMDINALNQMMREGPILSGAFVKIDKDKEDEIYQILKQSARVANVTLKGAALRTFERTIGENLLRMRFFNVLFASLIAFGVVFNSARIAMAERSRELATLRVIGFTRGEVSRLLLGEIFLLTVIAIPIGWLCGYGLAGMVINLSYDTELFRMPLVIERSTFAFATLVTLVATALSVVSVRGQIDQLDLVAVLKSKE